jgi:hypothetical protein
MLEVVNRASSELHLAPINFRRFGYNLFSSNNLILVKPEIAALRVLPL